MNTAQLIGRAGRLALVALLPGWLASCSVPPPPGAQVSARAVPTPPAPPINPVINTCNPTKPDAAITPVLLTSGTPCAPLFVPPFDLPNLQHAFDMYSWLTFIGLNAPREGLPPAPGNTAPTQWQGWREVSDIMLPNGAKPGAWNSPRVVPDACKAIPGFAALRIVRRAELNKAGTMPAEVTSEVNQPFDSGPLIDLNGNYVRYEILVNEPMYQYIVQNGLYNQQGQQAFAGPVAFPSGEVTSGSTGTMGALMIKAAWKVMGARDDVSRFHTVDALAYNPPSENPKVAESCSRVVLGLVGWHAAHKTVNEPQWNWSTFEHVDNVPDAGDVAAGRLRAHYSFYNPACKSCAVNQPPPRPWNPNIQPFPKGFTSQITRVTPLTDATVKLNTSFQAILTSTVWQHYELISTQWPTNAQSKVDPTGVPAPTFLANTTLETYTQGQVPQASSSCMACHNNAADTTGRPADFTFTLERARAAPK
ncbi:hypothetical protein DBR42_22705 [Pelomonas sp. HMWF004]|nr:hypothetical protein DBR42_22705 [Pelomonas sp. HMWF004]